MFVWTRLNEFKRMKTQSTGDAAGFRANSEFQRQKRNLENSNINAAMVFISGLLA